MSIPLRQIAARCVEGLDVRPGELVQVRYHAERIEVLEEALLAIERAGATPLPEVLPMRLLARLLTETDRAYLESWDRHRIHDMERVDRVLVLTDGGLERGEAPSEALDAWHSAMNRMVEVEETRRLPVLVVAMPSERRALLLGLSLEALDGTVLPALAVGAGELEAENARVFNTIGNGGSMTLRTGQGHELALEQGPRCWLGDDGRIDEQDRLRGAVVSNLPGGSLYTTVLESSAEGTLHLDKAAGATDILLRFRQGAIVEVQAAEGAERFTDLLDGHSGDARRISHIGIALNPCLTGPPLGWTLVDEHIQGAVFFALGENRYMGGENRSSLNVDFSLHAATLRVNGRTVVDAGRLTA